MPALEELLKEGETLDLGAVPKTKHAFRVRYTALDGKQYEGVFVGRLPSAEDYRQMAIIQSALTRGANWSSLSPDLQAVIVAMARCHVLLEVKPAWFSKPLEELGAELFLAISQELSQFESAFFREGSQDKPKVGEVAIEPIGAGLERDK
jgi:hypothetical protein